jgi:superfamily I DNA/RNA helicase
VGYIGVALDETDATSFKAMYNVPGGRYLGNEFLRAHPTLASAREALANGELGGRGRGWGKGVRDIVRTVDEVKEYLNAARGGVTEALTYIFDVVGVMAYFREEGADEEDETDVEQACEALVTCAGTIGDPGALVRYAREMTKVGHEDVGPSEGERTATPRITLSSCHKAKGLEWERVYVIGMTDRTFPFLKAPIDEERRLGYVALTRARDHLWVSWTTSGEGGAGPSCLVKEAGLLPRDEVAVEPATTK